MSKKKAVVIQAFFTVEDAKVIRSIAAKEDEPVSSWVRGVVLRELVKQGVKKDSKHKIREYNR